MTDLNAIKARLGSISPKTMASLPRAVQTLLTEDMPRLLKVVEKHGELAPPTPEQQIEDMPW